MFPLRQVFIEMLILEATLADASTTVSIGQIVWRGQLGWSGRLYINNTYSTSAAMDTTGVNNLGQPIQINPQTACLSLDRYLSLILIPFNDPRI